MSVRGLLGPALRAAFRDLRAADAPSATVFRLRLPAGQGPAEVIDLLRRKDLVLVSMRAVPEVELAPQPEQRPHLTPVT